MERQQTRHVTERAEREPTRLFDLGLSAALVLLGIVVFVSLVALAAWVTNTPLLP
jgi:hypothetical protein